MDEFVKKVVGLFVGQLDEADLELLEVAKKRGLVRVVYRGAAGFMGLGRIERA